MLYLNITALIISGFLFGKPLLAPETSVYYTFSPRSVQANFSKATTLVSDVSTQDKVLDPPGEWKKAIVTAYSPHSKSCGKWSKIGKTSTGVCVRSSDPNDVYGIAADPKMIPYGTKIYVPGYYEKLQNNKNLIPTEMNEVDDTGGAMRKAARRGILHIDIRFRTESEAQRWGSREMMIFIYE